MSVAQREVTVVNKHGLHVRPSTQLVNVANRFKSKITVSTDSTTADAKSVLLVMAMGAEVGTVLRFRAEGDDAEEAVEALADLVSGGFPGVVKGQ